MKARLSILLSIATLMACSVLNREGPNVTCSDLQSGAINACSEGIIATCGNGAVHWTVCDDKAACEASWQTVDNYRCTESSSYSPAQSPGTGGAAFGSGGAVASGGTAPGSGGAPGAGGTALGVASGGTAQGTGGIPISGGTSSSGACDTCIAKSCASQLTNCKVDSSCAALYNCIEACTDTNCGSSCVTKYPSYDFGQPLRQCVANSCNTRCPFWK